MTEGAVTRRLYTVPQGAAFADALAQGVLAEQGDPLTLPDVTILLPHRRAVRALSDAFLRASGGKPMLLPALRPIGDVDEDDAAMLAGDTAASLEDAELPPAIAPPRRLMLLARMILKRGDMKPSADQALRLADSLARLIDQAHTERRSLDGLKDLVPERFAAHWGKTLDFLTLITEHWPRILKEEGAMDPAERRDKALGLLAKRWSDRPPRGRVLIAGSTGSVPATADLMKVVAALPRGAVILPGFDRQGVIDDEQAILDDFAHPQHAMAKLVRHLELGPSEVENWPHGLAEPRPARARLLSAALRPANATHSWSGLKQFDDKAIEGVWRVVCPTPREEAAAIALMLREVLEDKGRTAALVTPDRALARRVAAELKRWNIAIDDFAGVDLADTPPAVFMRLAVRMQAERAPPVPLLACFKHPLAAGGMAREEFRSLTRQLERAALRGPRPAPGFDGLLKTLKNADEPDHALIQWVTRIADKARDFSSLLGSNGVKLDALLAAHWQFASFLATGADGVPRLQIGDAGEALALRLEEIKSASDAMDAIDGGDYPRFFLGLLRGVVVRPHRGQHPRLAIWGLLEARLQQADRLILGGLNESVWPPEPPDDPWLSRPMRQEFGLPLPERRIGLSAHDFAQGFLAREVIMTRSARMDGAPMVPSRWLMRLDAVLRVGGSAKALPAGPWLDWQDQLDRPEKTVAMERPAPCPPVTVRPRHLSVTQIETWMRDPYAIYARHILNLRKLDEIDEEPGASDRGILIHDALERFLRAYPKELPEDALDRLLEEGRTVFRPFDARPGVAAFWWPRFERAARWFVDEERKRRPDLAESAAEITGRLDLDGPAGPFRLTAKADRIDRLKSGGLVIIDYKTGQAPSPKQVDLGFAPQLPLEAAIAIAGGFSGVAKAPVASLEVWRLSGGAVPGEVKVIAEDPMGIAEQAKRGLLRLIATYDKADTPYQSRPRPAFAPVYSDYVHLARVQEWSAAEDES